MSKLIGKIQAVQFGMGGYDDAMMGISFVLGSEKPSWGVADFKGTWACRPSEHASWTVDDQTKQWGEMVRWIGELLEAAKVNNVADLKDVPIEVEFKDGLLKSWRILTEVI